MADMSAPTECRLLYYSWISPANGPGALADILRESRERNLKEDITGLLAHDQRFFMQVLEGGIGPVNDLYADLITDPRHYALRLIGYEGIESRLFPEWSMAMANIPGFSGRFVQAQYGGFDPRRFSCGVATEYMEILRDHLKEGAGRVPKG